MLLTQGLRDVEIRGEIAALAQHDLAPGRVVPGDLQRRTEHLVEIDRGAVERQHLTGRRANESGNFVAHAPGQLEPTRAVPTADQALPPLLGDGLRQALRRGPRQSAQGVAVEVNQAIGQIKQAAQAAQGILLIEL